MYLIGVPGIGPKDRARLLGHPRLSLSTLYRLASCDPESLPSLRDEPAVVYELRWGVARHRNTTPQLLRILLTLDGGRYDWEIARNRNVTPEILEHLGTEGRVVRAVAAHLKTPTHVIRRLHAAGEKEVLKAVGTNPRAPEELLIDISWHENRFVRAAVAGNQALPRVDLERLTLDESPLVRKTATKTLLFQR